MDPAWAVPLLLAAVAIALTLCGIAVVYRLALVRIEQGQALVINKVSIMHVSFSGGLVLPIVHKGEIVDIRAKTVVVARKGKNGVICADNIRADIEVRFHVRINATAQDVLKVVKTIGAARAGDQTVIEELFAAKFGEAIKTVVRQFRFETLHDAREELKERILALVGEDLSGYVLDDVSVDDLEQTPIEQLDPDNVLDAQGIEVITRMTEESRVRTAEARAHADRRLAQLEAEVKQSALEIERLTADGLESLRRATGRVVTREDLDDRLSQKLREMVDQVLADRDAAGVPVSQTSTGT